MRPGCSRPLALMFCGSIVQHAHFAGHDHAVVVREVVAAGPQAVAVEHRADVLAVGEHDRRRAVPRLHQARVVFVERPLVFRHRFVILPRLGNHHHDRFLQRAAAHQQEFEHVVERARVAAIGLGDREQLLRAPRRTARSPRMPCAGLHPVHVAAQRVDLAVVAHEPHRLRAVPRRETCWSRTASGPSPGGWCSPATARSGIVLEQLLGREHALVDDHLRRQRADVEHLRLRERRVAAKLVAGLLADVDRAAARTRRPRALWPRRSRAARCAARPLWR